MDSNLNPSKRAAADVSLKLHGHWYVLTFRILPKKVLTFKNFNKLNEDGSLEPKHVAVDT
jgi:hypothetical protein